VGGASPTPPEPARAEQAGETAADAAGAAPTVTLSSHERSPKLGRGKSQGGAQIDYPPSAER
jgi:hypothetical protein